MSQTISDSADWTTRGTLSNRVGSSGGQRSAATPLSRARSGRYAALLLVSGFATVFSLVATDILPAKYFFDASEVQQLAQGTYTLPADSEYTSAGATYRALGLENSPALVAIITMVIFTVALLVAVRSGRLNAARPTTLLIIFASPPLAAIYIAVYSKESIVLVAALIMLQLSKRRSGLWAMVGFALIYAVFFRLYWGLVAGLIPVAIVIMGRKPSYRRLVLTMILGVGLVAAAIAVHQHTSLTTLREGLNFGRTDSGDSVTAIPIYISGSSYAAGFFNSIVTLPLLLFPFPLLVHLSPQYFVAALFLMVVSVRLGGTLMRLARRCAGDPSDTVARPALLCAYAALSLAVVQSLYVPDYGSALKHFSPILPLVICALVVGDTLSQDDARGDARDEAPAVAGPVISAGATGHTAD